jgi:phosphatidylserine/phosphatidylglycerophosphate/cardiolipin synthase-like enzyme
MKRLLITLLTAICGAGLLGTYLVPTAQAAPYTPKQGVVFNNAAGNKTAERRAQTILDNAISAVPGCNPAAGCKKRQTITMAMYLFSQKSTADRLISAHKRGVDVHFLIDNGAEGHELSRLRKAFGTSTKNRSYVVKCNRGGCMSDYPYATIHVKYYLFSQSGTAKNVSIISSANPHRVNIYNSFNNSHTIVEGNKPVLYNRLMSYFTDMTKNKQNHYYGNGKNTSNGPFTLYIYPQRTSKNVQYLDVLNSVKCRTAANMGSKGRTVVRMNMWGFTNPRMDVAKKLWSLHNAGCKVDVTLNRGRASRTIMRQLLVKSKRYGQMVVEDAWKDKNRNDYGEQYTHHKSLIINGWVQGKNQRVVWTGSQNLTSNGSLYNDDMVLRVAGSNYYFAYSNAFSYIQKKSKRLHSTPPPIVLKSKREDARSLTPDQNVERQAELNEGG